MQVFRWVVLSLVAMLCACSQPSPATPTLVPPTPTETSTPQIGVAFATRERPAVQIVQLTPTPLPTATPTPTATPRIYLIQEGDTVWDIAYLNGTEPDILQTLNPALRPELLSVGQEVILPPPATPIFGVTSGQPVPLSIEVVSLRLFETPVGSLWLMGEVRNNGESPAQNVQITVDLTFDDSRQQSVTSWVVPAVLQPATTAPFAALVREIDGEITGSAAYVSDGSVLGDWGNRSAELEIIDSNATVIDNRATIEATVRNADANPVLFTLVAAVRNAAGQVVGIGEWISAEAVPPDATKTITLEFITPGGSADDYYLIVNAVRAVTE